MNIFGVGGHAKVVINAAILSGYTIVGLYDDDDIKHNSNFCGFKVKGFIDSTIIGSAIIAIGDNKVRRQISNRAHKAEWQTIIHPSAIISPDVEIGVGTIIMAGVLIQPGTKIGKHCIINTGACIDHDCKIGDYVHISPNCALAGGVSIQEGTFIGIGSSVIPYKTIGKWTIIGAGSVVIKDIPDFCTSVGVPSKLVRFNHE